MVNAVSLITDIESVLPVGGVEVVRPSKRMEEQGGGGGKRE